MKWQRAARLTIAVTAVAFSVGVGLSLRRRAPQRVEAPVARTDPKAVVESEGGQSFRVNREQEQIRIQYDKLLTYPDGTSKMVGVTVTTNRSGRIFTIAAKEGQTGNAESSVELTGDVQATASDGLVMKTARATYTEANGVARAPGFVEFSRGRMSGSGFGFAYDKNQNILSIIDEARVRVVPDTLGLGALDVAAGALEFRRNEKSIRFERNVKATRGRETIEAEIAVAHLSPDEQRLEAAELRGNSRISASSAQDGGLEALTGRDMDLTYRPDDQMLERAVVNGDAVMRLAGSADRPGRQLSANVVEIALGPDGVTLTSVTARENVKLSLPGGGRNGVSRLVASQTLEGGGGGSQGLTSARFAGNVQFSERGPGVDRAVRSAVLDVTVSPGFGTIDEAKFARGVRFADGPLFATSALARYVLDRGTLALGGSEPGSPRPHIVNDQVAIDAESVDVTLDGPTVRATGAVKSVLHPRTPAPGDVEKPSDVRLPSMLKQNQPVNVTSDRLDYVGNPSKATYSGNTLLWQGDTQIRSPSLVIDGSTANLTAAGPVATMAVLMQAGQDGRMERVRTDGTASAFTYDDATRRAAYQGDARLRGPQGDLTATTIELYLKASGDELEKVEAYDAVELRVEARRTTGARLTYFGDEGRYVVTGTPMKILDECGRETTGRSLTFFKSTDRIIADGNDQVRTQTKGTSSCPGT